MCTMLNETFFITYFKYTYTGVRRPINIGGAILCHTYSSKMYSRRANRLCVKDTYKKMMIHKIDEPQTTKMDESQKKD